MLSKDVSENSFRKRETSSLNNLAPNLAREAPSTAVSLDPPQTIGLDVGLVNTILVNPQAGFTLMLRLKTCGTKQDILDLFMVNVLLKLFCSLSSLCFPSNESITKFTNI